MYFKGKTSRNLGVYLIGFGVILTISSFKLTYAQFGASDMAAFARQERERRDSQAAHAQSVELLSSTSKMVLWLPKSKDVPRRGAAFDDFKFMLEHSDKLMYQVKSGDNLDKMLRTNLFVASSNEPRAYRAYRDFIREINQSDLNIIHPGDVIFLPSGPHYEAIPSQIADEAYYRERLLSAYNRHYRRLPEGRISKKAQRLETIHFNRRVFQSMGFLASAYSASIQRGPSKEKAKVRNQNQAVDELVSRRLLPARALDAQVDTESVKITDGATPTTRSLLASVSPLTLPAMTSIPTVCKAPCVTCNQLISAWDGSTRKSSKLLIEDTGLDLATDSSDKSAQPHAQYSFKVVNGKVVSSPVRQIGEIPDISTHKHGTFVFNEIAKSSKNGSIPDQSIYVARIADTFSKTGFEEGRVYMDAVHEAMKFWHNSMIAATRTTDAEIPSWVVNLSIEGPIDDTTADSSMIIHHDNILYVAAAGNRANDTAPLKNLYAKFNNANSNLLVVGALDEDGQKIAPYSSRNAAKVDIFVQGTCVCGLKNSKDSRAEQLNGTSQAAPVAAALAFRLATEHSSWSASAIKWRLISTSDELDRFQQENAAVGGKLKPERALGNNIILVRRPASTNDESHDEEITSIDTTNENWKLLLFTQGCPKPSCQVLRLHRGPSERIWFRQFLLGKGVEDIPPRWKPDISPDLVLPYTDAAGVSRTIQVKDLKDIIFPIKM